MGNNNGKKYWWLGICFTVGGLVFGAGGSAYLTRDALARHDRVISELTEKATKAEVNQARIEERLRSIDSQLAEIKALLKSRP